jgi:glycosyltransferase involved in cell wall biosynthesis
VQIVIASDAWTPQVNGVVRTLSAVAIELAARGHAVEMVTPDRFATIPCPSYPEIRLAVAPRRRVRAILDAVRPDAIHIATEGPIGLATRSYCLRRGYAFTTAFHTRFPEYIAARFAVPTWVSYALLRRFHAPSAGVMVAAESVRAELSRRGFTQLRRWTRGVDAEHFRPRREAVFDLPRPIFLTVSRLAVEKNLPAFLDLDLPGSKVVVGDGPCLDELRSRFPKVHFAGRQVGDALVRHYGGADAFVFPSRTDTFGLVLLEALACGLPVAAFPVPGPLDVVGDSQAGVLDTDLKNAALRALDIPRERCREHALSFTWQVCANQFLQHLRPLH